MNHCHSKLKIASNPINLNVATASRQQRDNIVIRTKQNKNKNKQKEKQSQQKKRLDTKNGQTIKQTKKSFFRYEQNRKTKNDTKTKEAHKIRHKKHKKTQGNNT